MEVVDNPAPGFLPQGILNAGEKTDFNPADHVLFSLFLFLGAFSQGFFRKEELNRSFP